MGVGVCIPQREKKQQSLSDVSEEMYNRVIWWLEGLCFSLLWVRCGGREAGGQMGGLPGCVSRAGLLEHGTCWGFD